MQIFKDKVIELLQPHVKGEIDLEYPPDPKMGDLAFPCFSLSKELRKNPAEIAKELAGKLKSTIYFEKISALGPYVNFFVNKQKLAEQVIPIIFKENERYGRGKKKKEKIMVEHSGPNTHKGFHIGHLRNTALGDALVRILRFYGYSVLAANYLNVTGTHVAKCLWYFKKKYKSKAPKRKRGEWLGKVYGEAARELQDNEAGMKEVYEIHRRIEAGDPDVMNVWEETKQWSIDEFNRIYSELGVVFDAWFFDNELIGPGKEIVQDLFKRKIAEKSEGALIVNLEKEHLEVALILKSDGTCLYLTKDLGLAKIKFDNYKINKSLYVTGTEQILHFKQLFRILDLWGFKQAKNCYHLGYELVMLKEGKMSSREGSVILYSQLSDAVRKHAKKEVRQRHKEWSDDEVTDSVHAISLGAMKFGMLHQDSHKVIHFDIKEALAFEGETGPYCQYAYARACSVLRRSELKVSDKVDFSLLTNEKEIALLKLLSLFPSKVAEAAEHYKPALLSRYLIDVAQAFTDFYENCQILKEKNELKKARLLLLECARIVLRNNLEVLGMPAPSQM